MHSKNYERIKKWYNKGNGVWTAEMVEMAWHKGQITEEEYHEIVGE